jgi:arginase
MEVALLLGMTGADAPDSMGSRLPALAPEAIAMLGQRDANYRDEIGVSSIADRVLLHGAEEVRRDPEPMAARAAAHVGAQAPGWWLHVDLDVLDASAFRACGAASDPTMPEGLSWAQLTQVTTMAVQAGGCRGWSVGVYNADLDPDGRDAQRVVAYLAEVAKSAASPLPG